MGTVEQEVYPPRVLLRACVLLLLREQPGHGYDLIERIKSLGFERVDRSVYRALDWLEEAEYVRSRWDTPDTGPARRVYELTPAGEDKLRAWAENLEALGNLVNEYLTRFQAVAPTGGARRGRRARH